VSSASLLCELTADTASKASAATAHYKVSPELGVIEIGKTRFDYKKVRELYGKDLCWARALTSKADVEACCPYAGSQGHKKGDSLHSWSTGRRDYFLRNITSYTLPDLPSTSMQAKSVGRAPYKHTSRKLGN
jgi:hypothetical protein